MNTRFIMLFILTVALEIICAGVLLLGVVIMLNANQQTATVGSPDILNRIPEMAKIAGGGALAFYGLIGLVFAGAVHVLMAIEANTHKLNEKFASLAPRKTVVLAPEGIPPVPSAVANPAQQSVPVAARTEARCSQCGVSNVPDSRFCESCGSPLAAS